MKRRVPLSLIPVFSFFILTSAYGVEFHDLGTLPGTTNSAAYAVSADGSVVVGESYNDGGEFGNDVGRAFRWTKSGGMQDLGVLPGGLSSSASGVSADGSVIVGGSGIFVSSVNSTGGFDSTIATHPFIWTQASGLRDLYTLPTPGWASASDVSADGSVVVGWFSSDGKDHAFRWTQSGGMEDIGVLPGARKSSAKGVSADGSVVVGQLEVGDENAAFRWTPSGGMQEIGPPRTGFTCWATDVSADGSVIVCDGQKLEEPGFGPNFLWTQPGGLQSLPSPAGATGTSAWGVSGGGSVVVGEFGNSRGQYRAFRWSKSDGAQDLNTLLPSLGVDLTGWTLEVAEAVSSDGTTIVGQGVYNGAERAFAVSGFPAGGKKLQSATFKLPSKMVYDGSYALRATFSCKGSVTYSVNDGAVAQVSGNQLKILKANAPFSVTARQAGDTTWAAAEVQAGGTAAKKPQRIAFTVRSSAIVGQTLPLSVTVNSSLAVTVTSSDSGIVRINNDGTATALAKGRAVLTAVQNGDPNHGPAKPVQKTVSVR